MKTTIQLIALALLALSGYIAMGLASMFVTWFANTTAWILGPAIVLTAIGIAIHQIIKAAK